MPRLVSQAAMFNNTWYLALPPFLPLLTLLFSPRLFIALDRGILGSHEAETQTSKAEFRLHPALSLPHRPYGAHGAEGIRRH
jgi:hypothetical protein